MDVAVIPASELRNRSRTAPPGNRRRIVRGLLKCIACVRDLPPSSDRSTVGSEGAALLGGAGAGADADRVSHGSNEATSPSYPSAGETAENAPVESERRSGSGEVPSAVRRGSARSSGRRAVLNPPATEQGLADLRKDLAATHAQVERLGPIIEGLRQTALSEAAAGRLAVQVAEATAAVRSASTLLSARIPAKEALVAPIQEPGMLRTGEPPTKVPVSLYDAERCGETCAADCRICTAKMCEEICTGGTILPAAIAVGVARAGYVARHEEQAFNWTEACLTGAWSSGLWCAGTAFKTLRAFHDLASGARFAREAQDESLPYAAARREIAARFQTETLQRYERWARGPTRVNLTTGWELAKLPAANITELGLSVGDKEVGVAALRLVANSVDDVPDALKKVDELCRANRDIKKVKMGRLRDEYVRVAAPTLASVFDAVTRAYPKRAESPERQSV